MTARGEVVAVAGENEEILIGTLPGADLDGASDVFPVMRDRRPEVYSRLVDHASSFALLGDPES